MHREYFRHKANRIKFIACTILMLLSLFMGAVSIVYRWEIIWILFFTLLFSLFLVFAVYIYMSGQRASDYDRMRKEKEDAELDAERRMQYFINMAHEIRTPINAILGYDELILREYNDPALRQYAANIRAAGNTLLSLVNDSLDYSRIEAGKMSLMPEEYDLGNMLQELLSLIRPRALAKGLELKGYVSENMPRVLYGDMSRIKQCIANLLTNAVKYTEDGEIDFSVSCKMLDTDIQTGRREILLQVSVRDTGIGIRDEDIKKLYSPYERIEEEKIKAVEGSGLGLSIVRRILNLMDSELEVESIYGKGSNFHFAVKQQVMGEETIGDFEENYAKDLIGKEHHEVKFIAPRARVLVVDDAELNLAVMEGLIKETRISVDSALSAATGLEMALANRYDLIFADIRMPGVSKGEMLRALRGSGQDEAVRGKKRRWSNRSDGSEEASGEKLLNRDTPVIALTAGALQEVQSEYKKRGYADYLIKPIVFKELELVLQQYLPEDKLQLIPRAYVADESTVSRANTPCLATEEKFREAMDILSRRELTN